MEEGGGEKERAGKEGENALWLSATVSSYRDITPIR